MMLFIARRLGFVLPQLLLVVIGTFLLLRALPADPVAQIVGLFPTKDAIEVAKHNLGLDRSVGDQLRDFLSGVVRLDFGNSWTNGTPVTSEIGERLPVTLQLIVLAFVIALVVAVPLALASAARPGGKAETGTRIYALFAGAQPDFWWALVFIYLFYFKLGWFPAPLGLLDPGVAAPPGPTHFVLIDSLIRGDLDIFVSALRHYALPVFTLAFVLTGPILKIMRQAALDVLESDYLLYARASGFSRGAIRRVVLRNAFAPVLTVTGILFGFSLGGAVLIETIFSLNGLGRYALQSTLNVDYPAIQGAVIVMTTFSLAMYLIMDICHALVDPRVRHGRK